MYSCRLSVRTYCKREHVCAHVCVCMHNREPVARAAFKLKYQKFVRSDADVAAVFVVGVFFTSLWYLLFATTTLPALWAVLLLHVRVVRLLWRIRAVIVLSSIT